MDTTLLLLCCGLLVGFSGAQTSSPNPECADLIALKKHAERGIKLYPGASLHCNPNKNCSGLSCNGKIGKKSFKGTVILQGCKDPVTLLVHFGNREFTIRDNQKTKISSKLQVVTRLRKADDSVYVTITLDPCLVKCGGPIKYDVVKNQRIRVRCNGSNIRSPATRMPPASLVKPNPECKGLINTKKSVERHFNQISGILSPGSKISCHPNKKCSELDCTGVANKDHFNATATIEYCSPPIRMRLKVDATNKNLHFDHDFKDGQKVEVSKIPPAFVVVRLKRIENVVYVTVSGTVLAIPYTLVKNMSITVDPSHCPGYIAPVRYPRCKGLLTLGKSIENRMSKFGEPERTFATCKTDKQCNELSCHGKFRNHEFHSVASLDYCSSPTILHMHIEEGNHTHAFKDGDTFNMPHPMTVGLKRTGNDIVVNISIAKYVLVQNVIVSVDPNYCSKPGGKSKSLSGAVTALIVLSAIIFIASVTGLVVWLRKTKRFSLRRPARYNDLAMSDDSNPLYDDSEPAMA